MGNLKENIDMYVIETWIEKKKKNSLGPFIYFIRKINISALSVKCIMTLNKLAHPQKQFDKLSSREL